MSKCKVIRAVNPQSLEEKLNIFLEESKPKITHMLQSVDAGVGILVTIVYK